MPVASEQDLLRVRAALRSAADLGGLGLVSCTKLVTAGSELARNILRYADGGSVCIRTGGDGPLRGIHAIFSDSGPGIADLEAAMRDGFTTAGGLGLGLPGARRLVDEFSIESAPGRGTKVVIVQWTH
jgi:serine/threonine-protein kinase RsbT